MAEPLILAQADAADLDAVTALLTDAFAAARDAVVAERPVVFLLDDRDLLGQGEVADAAVATGLLGLMRALAFEGAKPGWRVNAVAHRDEEGAAREAAAWLASSGLSGQLIRVGSDHLGKVLP